MNKLAIYIHWPFCTSKCPYCDFNSHVTSIIDHEVWLKSYVKELSHFSGVLRDKYITSIFFGGGTPSLMQPKVVAGVIDAIAKLANINEDTEITLEANPTSFEIDKFSDFKLAGINRVSIGVQALDDHSLSKLGRVHSSEQAVRAITLAANIFQRLSFDLIYARSGQSLKEWQAELVKAMQLAKGHISLYQLTIEKGTAFYTLFRKGELILPDSDLAAAMYSWTTDYLESCGYYRYEISNYSILGHESVHNLAYWKYNSYLGIGPGAHSRIKINDSVVSMMMWHKPNKWLGCVEKSGCGIQSSSELNVSDIITEFMMMGLRLPNGINIKDLQILGKNKALEEILDFPTIKNYQQLDLLKWDNNQIYLTSKGLMLHNYLVPRLLTISENIT